MNEKLNIDVKTLKPFTRFIYTIGELPTSYLMSMTYEEQLVWLCNYLSTTVIPTINNNGEAVKEVQDLVLQLQDYINNYFDNLDVQEEINNKLDEMAESGQLTDIIAQYLGLAGLLVYNTISDMKNATNIVNGSSCKTLGFYNINDGGGALYKVRQVNNTDNIDEITIFALHDNNLIAELLIENNEINMKQVGCSSSLTDNSYIINSIIQKYCNEYEGNKNIMFPTATYPLTGTIQIEKGHFIFDGNNSIFKQFSNNTPIIEFTYPTSPLYTSDLTLKNVRLEFNEQQTQNNGYGIKFDHMAYQCNFENIVIIKPYIGIGCVSNIDESLWKMKWEQILINSFYYRGFDLNNTSGSPQNYFGNIYLQCAGVTITSGCCFYAKNLQAVISNIEVNTNNNGCELLHLLGSSVVLNNFVCETLTVASNRLFNIIQSTLSMNNLLISEYDGEFGNNNALIDNNYSSVNIEWLKINKKASATGNLTIVRNSDTGGTYNHITKIGRISNYGNQKVSDYTLTATNGKGLVEVGKEPIANYQTLNADTKIYGDIFIKQLTGDINLSFDPTTMGIGEYTIIVNDFNSHNITLTLPHFNGAWISTNRTLTDTQIATYKIVFVGRPYNLAWILYKNGQVIESINL